MSGFYEDRAAVPGMMKRSLSESSTGSSTGGESPARPSPSSSHSFKIPKRTDLSGDAMASFQRRESQTSTTSTSTFHSVSEEEDGDGFDSSRMRQYSTNSESADESFNPIGSASNSNSNSEFTGMSSVHEPGQYSSIAQRLMSKMGHKPGEGLGKAKQGIKEPVRLSTQKGRRGLGHIIEGLEEERVDWDPSREVIEIEETVRWMPPLEREEMPDPNELAGWMRLGKRKTVIDDENIFCDQEVLSSVLKCKSVFDKLEGEEMRKARTRSNPFETIRGGIFQNRAAMKMANMDAVFDSMFSKPTTPDGRPLIRSNELLYFADVCAGPGGFSEYILWRKKWRAKGFGFTLKGPCDFKLEDFFAGPAETFEPHYGDGGLDGDGNIFCEKNITAFENYVLEHTDGKGVHFMMADGGFSVEGQENIQEILSKQLYLCQFLVALGIVRPHGSFVCKLFDLFTPFSIGLIYLMSLCFENVSLHKPNTSRPANSERYIICKWKKEDTSAIHYYMLKINAELNRLGMNHLGQVDSDVDVMEVVPLDVLTGDTEFYEYIKEMNNIFGERQIIGLAKIAAFCKDQTLRELRQAEIREQCLSFWKVPNETRRAPPYEQPQAKLDSLCRGNVSFLTSEGQQLLADNFPKFIRSPFDWKFVILGSTRESRANMCWLLGLGRTKIFMHNPQKYSKWEKLDDSMKFELPAGTLIYAEIVNEIRGEKMRSLRLTSIHVVDAAFIGGEDLRHRDFKWRNEQIQLLVKAVNKVTVKDYIQLRAKQVFSLERIEEVMGRFTHRIFKGIRTPRVVWDVDIERDETPRYFVPSGLLLFRIVSEPYTIARSKTTHQKYWFNCATNKSAYECPKDAVVDLKRSLDKRLVWMWDEGVAIDRDLNGPKDPDKLQPDQIIDFVRAKC